MASSAVHPEGNHLLRATWHIEEEIHFVDPISYYNPNGQEGIQGYNQALFEPEGKLKASVKIREETGHFILAETDVRDVMERDEVFVASSEFKRYEKVWVPMSARLTQWTIEIRQRKNGGRIDKFYHHRHLRRQLRSMKQVYEYLHYGFVPDKQWGSSCSSDADNSFRPTRQGTQKEEVEAFLGQAWSNLMNLKSHENQKSGR